MNFTLGSDPELFLKKNIGGVVEYFPAVGVVDGNKYDPTPIDDKGRNILVDNVMLEFNTLPSSNIKDFVNEHNQFLEYLTKEMNSKNCMISRSAFVEFEDRFLRSESAKTFGCDPDYNAYTLKTNIPPTADVNTRSAAGHIHIGYDNHTKEKSIELIKLLDLTLGTLSVIEDKDTNRRQMYGKAGAFRYKDFGFEYRVLSNYWVFDDKYLEQVYKGVEQAFTLYDKGYKMSKELSNDVIKAIDTYDIHLSKIINKKLNNNICVD